MSNHRAEWQAKFEQFHQDNPDVYEMMVKDAFKAINAGKKCSIYLLVERVRWFKNIEVKGAQEFKINNNFSPFYARKMMAEIPGMQGFFSIRDAEPKQTTFHGYQADSKKIDLPDYEAL